MESFIKLEGIASMRDHSTEALEVTIKNLSLEANTHLINAAYAESLLSAVDEQVEQYTKLLDETHGKIADIEEQASKALSAQEGYNIRKEKKPLEAMLRSYQQGKDRMLERKAGALEKINAHRFDAQAIMHRIAFLKATTGDAIIDTLEKHIKDQRVTEATEEVVPEPETPPEVVEETTPDESMYDTEETAAEANTRE